MESGLMFVDCPAYLDEEGAVRCGLPAEVRSRFTMNSSDGPLEAAMIRCPAGHWFTGPFESLTLATRPGRAAALPCPAENGGADGVAAMMTDRLGSGICPGAGLPGAHLPGHRPLRHAARVIVALLLTGLAAAVVCVVLALAGSVGSYFPGPPPHRCRCPTRPRHRRAADQGTRAVAARPLDPRQVPASVTGPARRGPGGANGSGWAAPPTLPGTSRPPVGATTGKDHPTARREQSPAQSHANGGRGPGSPVSRPARPDRGREPG